MKKVILGLLLINSLLFSANKLQAIEPSDVLSTTLVMGPSMAGSIVCRVLAIYLANQGDALMRNDNAVARKAAGGIVVVGAIASALMSFLLQGVAIKEAVFIP